MKIFIWTSILTLAAILRLSGQLVQKSNLQYKNATYDVFVIHCDSNLFKTITILENTSGADEESYFNSLSTQSPFFCITAGIVDSSCSPLGLYVENSVVKHPVNNDKGNGNFYLKPNGVLMVDSAITITDAEHYTSTTAVTAIQSGPMLLVNGKVHPGFDPKSANRNFRCGAGIYSDKGQTFLVFIKSLTPISFYTFAEIFKDKYKCTAALNLESGANCSMHLPTIKKSYSIKTKICRYIFIKL